MHRDQLALQMSGELGEMESVSGQGIEHLFTIGLALCGQLQVEQAAVPGWNLYALVAHTAHPVRDILQVVERSRVTGKLGQEDCRALDGLDGHREFALRNIRQLIYTSLQINVGANAHASRLVRMHGLGEPCLHPNLRPRDWFKGALHARQPACTYRRLVAFLCLPSTGGARFSVEPVRSVPDCDTGASAAQAKAEDWGGARRRRRAWTGPRRRAAMV